MLRQESGPRTNHWRSEKSASRRDVRKLKRYARVRQKSNGRTEYERERAAPQTVSRGAREAQCKATREGSKLDTRGEGEAQEETKRREVETRKEDVTKGERGTLAKDTRAETRNASHGGIILRLGSRDERQNGATKIANMVNLFDLWICTVVIIVEKRKIATKEPECKRERPAFFIECHPCSQVLLF